MIAADFSDLTGPVVVACSGGPDSVALLVLAAEAALDPVAVHVDHGLRPDSAADADVVAAVAAALGVRWRSMRVAIGAGGNLEARARDARYGALRVAREELGATAILVGHTADDQAETVLLNLMRGAATPGLGGMAPRRGDIVRPLLHLRRDDVRAVAVSRGLPTVDDPTNRDTHWRRSWVRHELLPMLGKGSERDLVPVLARQADVVRAESDLLDELGDALLARGTDGRHRGRGAAAGGAAADHPPRTAPVARQSSARGGRDREGRGGGPGRPGGRRARRRPGGATIGRTAPPRAAGAATLTAMLEPPLGSPLGAVVVSSDVLQTRVAELGARISADYAGRAPLLVGILKGAFMFMSDLSRAIDLPVEFDFMAVSSYGSATRSSGVVRIIKDLDINLDGRDVIIVEDIVDSGLTLAYLRRTLLARDPASLEVCTLLLKEGQQKSDPDLRYVGFAIPPTFVVGYGLDVAERYRNLDHVVEYTA